MAKRDYSLPEVPRKQLSMAEPSPTILPVFYTTSAKTCMQDSVAGHYMPFWRYSIAVYFSVAVWFLTLSSIIITNAKCCHSRTPKTLQSQNINGVCSCTEPNTITTRWMGKDKEYCDTRKLYIAASALWPQHAQFPYRCLCENIDVLKKEGCGSPLVTMHHWVCPGEPMQPDIQQSIADLIKIFIEQEVHLFLFILGAEIKIMKEKWCGETSL